LLEGTLRVGDTIEIRPGKVVQCCHESNGIIDGQHVFTVQPLATVVVEISTTLFPSCCANDLLAGSIIGLSGTLPPVWEVLYLDGVLSVLDTSTCDGSDDDESEAEEKAKQARRVAKEKNIKSNDEIRLHVGPACVQATIVKVSERRGKLEAVLHQPLCTLPRSNVAIERKHPRSGAFQLVAHGRIFGGRQCKLVGGCVERATHPVSEPAVAKPQEPALRTFEPKEIMDVLCEPDFFRERFLDALSRHCGGSGVAGRVKIPPPDLAREGGAHCVWHNFGSVAEALGRTAEHFLAFMTVEGRLRCSRSGPEGTALRIGWRSGGPLKLQRKLCGLIHSYARAFIVCHQCRGACTDLLRDRSLHHTRFGVGVPFMLSTALRTLAIVAQHLNGFLSHTFAAR